MGGGGVLRFHDCWHSFLLVPFRFARMFYDIDVDILPFFRLYLGLRSTLTFFPYLWACVIYPSNYRTCFPCSAYIAPSFQLSISSRLSFPLYPVSLLGFLESLAA